MKEQYSAMRSNVNMLGKLLGDTIKEALGIEILERVENIRQLSKSSRSGNNVHRKELLFTLQNLSNDELLPVARAFHQFLNLTNVAEQHQIITSTTNKINHINQNDLLVKTFENLKKSNIHIDSIHTAIESLSLELVLTAHPTEITRRTLIHKLREINNCLQKLEHTNVSKYEHDQVMRRLRQLIAQAWHTDEIRKNRPTPIDEAQWGLTVIENSLWDGVPAFLRELNKQVKKNFNINLPVDFVPIKFISWMGGDRDGNPNITASITCQVMQLNRWKATNLFLRDIDILISELSMSKCSKEVRKLCGDATAVEPYRLILKRIRKRLVDTQECLERSINKEVLRYTDNILVSDHQLWHPLLASYKSLHKFGMGIIANGYLLDTLRRVKCFGLALVRMDIRQDSTRHMEAIAEITHYLGIGKYEEWSEFDKQTFLINELNSKRPLLPRNWLPTTKTSEVLNTCKVIAKSPQSSVAAYIVSMTKNPSDILAVHLLLKETGIPYTMPVVPLFETLDDLNNANNVMKQLLNISWYRKLIKGQQMVMIGYSDSAKDAGVMAASWAQYQAQDNLIKTCNIADIKLTLFHGRGGTIGRGGAPAHAALLSQPPGSLKGGLRVTEQGEMIRFKYGLPEVTSSSLLLYTSAILEANLLPPPEPKKEWQKIMNTLSKYSCSMYRSYVQEHPDFLRYFRLATPELELDKLPLGSRPSKRFSNGGIESLRAIPWIFAWTQNRLMLPAWLGAGTALDKLMEQGYQKQLEIMCREWPFFSTRIGMLEMVFLKADLWLAEYYDQRLVDKSLWPLGKELRSQMNISINAVLTIANDSHLMVDQPWIIESINLRNVYTDPLNVLQAELLYRLRTQKKYSKKIDSRIEQALMVTIAGIAAGMRNTG